MKEMIARWVLLGLAALATLVCAILYLAGVIRHAPPAPVTAATVTVPAFPAPVTAATVAAPPAPVTAAPYTGTPAPTPVPVSATGLSSEAIVGIVLGAVAFVILIILGILIVKKRRDARSRWY